MLRSKLTQDSGAVVKMLIEKMQQANLQTKCMRRSSAPLRNGHFKGGMQQWLTMAARRSSSMSPPPWPLCQCASWRPPCNTTILNRYQIPKSACDMLVSKCHRVISIDSFSLVLSGANTPVSKYIYMHIVGVQTEFQSQRHVTFVPRHIRALHITHWWMAAHHCCILPLEQQIEIGDLQRLPTIRKSPKPVTKPAMLNKLLRG